MKTIKLAIIFALIGFVSILSFYSCNNPVSLGSKIDVDGPVVEFTAPVPRKAVGTEFSLEGMVSDYSDIKEMLIKVTLNNIEFAKQWRYSLGQWEISVDSGRSWKVLEDAEWNGTSKAASWKIPIDMIIGNVDPQDGEYVFSVQAWDMGGFSDDNSYKTIVLIFDSDPPRVELSNPNLYGKYVDDNVFLDEELQSLHIIADESDEWKDSAMIGKLLTQEFLLQWQIEDNHDIWSIDLRFYKHDTQGIDDNPETELPSDYIFRYHQNLPPPPVAPDPNSNINPNGSVMVPDLAGRKVTYNGEIELKNPITEKTTVRVVASCYDAAGHPNQEKTLGYFIFWPKADTPWIVYAEGLEEEYPPLLGGGTDPIIPDIYMVYPGRNIKATAFHYMGVSHVEYELYDYGNKTVGIVPGPLKEAKKTIENPPRFNGVLSTIFPWEFTPPSSSGYYKVIAEAFDAKGKGSGEYAVVFEVQDITFPDFPVPPSPSASNPLFMSINNGTITISGTVTDATEIKSLCMVWINPQSRNYAAMAQLAYFRDKDYYGWGQALGLSVGQSTLESGTWVYDSNSPNRLWKLPLEDKGIDYSTGRKQYSYSQTINLNTHLNIPGTNLSAPNPLASQAFLLRAENPDGKCTIITYAPQGDTSPPEVIIDRVVVSRVGSNDVVCIPSEYYLIPLFQDNDKITVYGRWSEDSTQYLPIENYLVPNLKVTVNGYELDGLPGTNTTKTVSPSSGRAANGTFEFSGIVGSTGTLRTSVIKDAIVVAAHLTDVGGNPTEAGASWLIQSDALRFLRLSSEITDATYSAGTVIDFFLEFSKPVRLKAGRSSTPVLTLNLNNGSTGGTATYVGNSNTMENTRQYFRFTVANDQNTDRLNVTGIQGGDNTWQNAGYPFTFEYTGEGGFKEEVRMTSVDRVPGAGAQYTTRKLPVDDNSNVTENPDYIYTLHAGKHITIDTAPLSIQSITANTPQGYYTTGSDIYINVRLNKAVTIGTGADAPRLSLYRVTNGSTNAFTDPLNIKVNGQEITFVYKVVAGDTTNEAAIVVAGHTGVIQDIAGNKLAAGAISGRAQASRTLTGVIIDTIKPERPTVRVLSANNVNNVIGTPSGADEVNLSNLYNNSLWLAIQPEDQYADLEYSINGGTSWIKAPNFSNTAFSLSQTGSYNVIARQTDRAGNVSDTTNPVNFNWDKGTFVTRISSVTPNGTYTNNPQRPGEKVDITVQFRKPVKFSGSPVIVLATTLTPAASRTVNVISGYINASGTNVTAAYPANTLVTGLTFTYTVGTGDNTSTGARLDVASFNNLSGITARDADDVIVNDYIQVPGSPYRLQDSKEIRVQTYTAALTGTLSTTNNTINDDGFNTTLVINFNRAISKGTGNDLVISIIQDASNNSYRLPAVLTESQSNRFKNIAQFNNFYTRGTNGYINGTGVDTSTKFILRYDIDTSIVPYTGDTATLANNFRDAEKIDLNVNSQAVTVSGTQLRVNLSGSNALKVPGANYLVTYSAGLVQDDLSYLCTAANNQTLAVGGVAKPFVRINKVRETITIATNPSLTQPRLVATQPFQADVRMDCRTPGVNYIYYLFSQAPTTTDGGNTANWTTAGPGDLNTPAAPGRPNDPQTTTANRQTYNGEFQIGTNNNYQGLRWYVRVKANKGSDWSDDSEEMAFRTVVTYVMNGIAIDNNQEATQQILATGDQLWIRGGDAIGSSSVPGFPLTWEDDWDNLRSERKRAGIGLMTRTTNDTTTNLNSSTWKWITWEISTDAYFDIILGRDTSSTAAEATQYGPKQWAYQRAGWTSFKTESRILPGKHRWLVSSNPDPDKGRLNFSNTLSARPTLGITYP
jgi:hypothetical protein